MYTFIRKNKKIPKEFRNILEYDNICYAPRPWGSAVLWFCLPGRRLTMGGDGAILFKITCVGNERSRG